MAWPGTIPGRKPERLLRQAAIVTDMISGPH